MGYSLTAAGVLELAHIRKSSHIQQFYTWEVCKFQCYLSVHPAPFIPCPPEDTPWWRIQISHFFLICWIMNHKIQITRNYRVSMQWSVVRIAWLWALNQINASHSFSWQLVLLLWIQGVYSSVKSPSAECRVLSMVFLTWGVTWCPRANYGDLCCQTRAKSDFAQWISFPSSSLHEELGNPFGPLSHIRNPSSGEPSSASRSLCGFCSTCTLEPCCPSFLSRFPGRSCLLDLAGRAVGQWPFPLWPGRLPPT